MEAKIRQSQRYNPVTSKTMGYYLGVLLLLLIWPIYI